MQIPFKHSSIISFQESPLLSHGREMSQPRGATFFPPKLTDGLPPQTPGLPTHFFTACLSLYPFVVNDIGIGCSGNSLGWRSLSHRDKCGVCLPSLTCSAATRPTCLHTVQRWDASQVREKMSVESCLVFSTPHAYVCLCRLGGTQTKKKKTASQCCSRDGGSKLGSFIIDNGIITAQARELL